MHPRRHLVTALTAIVACVVTAVLTAPASAASWKFETLDGAGGTNGRIAGNVGLGSSSVVWNNQPHAFYYDSFNGELRHAWWSGTAWFFETLDGNGGANGRTTDAVGVYSVATVWNNQPHVFYYEGVAGIGDGDLRHAWWNGAAWFFETLDGHQNGPNGEIVSNVGIDTSVAIWNNQPHLFYWEHGSVNGNGNLRHAWWNGVDWYFETLDGDSTAGGRVDANVGVETSAVVWSGQPHVFYHDVTNTNLRHAWWTGTKWSFETLDGNSPLGGRIDGDAGRDNAAVVIGGQPHVFYRGATSQDLRQAWWNGAKWNYLTLDGHVTDLDGRITGLVGYDAKVLLWRGQPNVFYRDTSNDDLRQAWWNGAKWQFRTLDGNSSTANRINGDVGDDVSAVFWNNQPHLFYFDRTNDDHRHAWFG